MSNRSSPEVGAADAAPRPGSAAADPDEGNDLTRPPRLQPTFLEDFRPGRRFGVWVRPASGVTSVGAILAIQPFADEANLSRRVLLTQARRLAAYGWSTLIVDLYGTGDSDGKTSEATLATWRADLLTATRIARSGAPGRFVIWGVRMGALLATDIVIALDQIVDRLVLWQAPPTGAALIDPLLKLGQVGRVAREAAANGAEPAGTSEGGDGDGSGDADPGLVDLAGYRLQRTLLDDLAGLALDPPSIGEHGMPSCALLLGIQRVVPASGIPKPLAQLAERWERAGHEVSAIAVSGEPFWSSLEPSLPVAAFEATESFLGVVHETRAES